MVELNKNKAGLSLGIVFLIVHALWFLILVAGFGEQFISWMVEGHFIKSSVETIEFNLFTALFTLMRVFIAGYAAGWLFTFFYNTLEGGRK